MSKPKQSIKVSQMIDFANDQLKRDDEWVTSEYKNGIITMIEKILHETSNYRGFVFLDPNDSEFKSPGYYSRRYNKSLK